MWSFREISNIDVQAAAKVQTRQGRCSKLLTDHSRSYKILSAVGDINFQEGKVNLSHTERQFSFLWSSCALKVKWSSIFGLGKAVVAVSWLRRTMLFSLKKLSIVCLTFSLPNFSFSSTNNFVLKMPAKHFARLNGCFRR
jgi:hypothetical protein